MILPQRKVIYMPKKNVHTHVCAHTDTQTQTHTHIFMYIYYNKILII